MAKLNIKAPHESRAAKVREEILSTQGKISEMSGIVDIVDEKNKKEKAARSDLEKIRQERDALNRFLQDARHKQEKAGLDHDRFVKDRDAALSEAEKVRTSALADVKPFGILQLPSSDLDAISIDLTERKNVWQAKLDEKIEHEKKVGELNAEILKISALLDNLEKDLVTRREAYDNLVREYSELAESRQELFGEKDANQEEKCLAEAVGLAEKSMERAREAHGQMEREISVLKERIGLLKDKTEKREKELTQAAEGLNNRIQKAGFKDEADFASARMADKERESLADKEQTLTKGCGIFFCKRLFFLSGFHLT